MKGTRLSKHDAKEKKTGKRLCLPSPKKNSGEEEFKDQGGTQYG